eukprot:9487353-Pyramimonas_sp.AAC.1
MNDKKDRGKGKGDNKGGKQGRSKKHDGRGGSRGSSNAPSKGKSRVCYAYSRGPQNCDGSCGREHRLLTKQEKQGRDAWEQSLQ